VQRLTLYLYRLHLAHPFLDFVCVLRFLTGRATTGLAVVASSSMSMPPLSAFATQLEAYIFMHATCKGRVPRKTAGEAVRFFSS